MRPGTDGADGDRDEAFCHAVAHEAGRDADGVAFADTAGGFAFADRLAVAIASGCDRIAFADGPSDRDLGGFADRIAHGHRSSRRDFDRNLVADFDASGRRNIALGFSDRNRFAGRPFGTGSICDRYPGTEFARARTFDSA